MSPPYVPENIVVAKYPADGFAPHTVTLRTTKDIENSRFSFLRHAPDVKSFWGGSMSSLFCDMQRVDVENQPTPLWHGVYYFLYINTPGCASHRNFPTMLFRDEIFTAKDVFLIKTAPNEFRANGFANLKDFPSALLDHPLFKV